MKHVAIHELNAHCSALLNAVANKMEPIIITRHGKPLAKIVPVVQEDDDFENPLKGTLISYGDIESPIDIDWEAMAK